MKNSSDSDSKDQDNKNDDNKSKENLNFLKVVKEKLNFPCKFDCDTTLRKIMNYYDKNWGQGIFDDEDEENDGDDDSDKVKYDFSSSTSSSEKKKKKKNIYDSSSSD